MVYAWASCLVYSFGIPAALWVALYKHRHELNPPTGQARTVAAPRAVSCAAPAVKLLLMLRLPAALSDEEHVAFGEGFAATLGSSLESDADGPRRSVVTNIGEAAIAHMENSVMYSFSVRLGGGKVAS